ncbi:MAG: hypothetical protein C5B44_05680 [Acidobacteria bacterium]|nr:MAG: hypothetical protein C5B44_05680 [Acidobacteriota bacterium]
MSARPPVPAPDDMAELEEGQIVTTADVTSALAIAKGEIDMQIATAKRYPRSITQFIETATELVTLDQQTAEECIYALPRDGKTIEGPSARFAEILAYAWGNCRAGARTVGEDAQFVKSQGVYYDLEKNVGIQFEVARRITDRRGIKYKPDMIGTTANAAGSIALRNAVLKGIPKAFWKKPYERARAVVAGDFKTLANRRAEALKQFAVFGVTPEMIYELLAVRGVEDVTLDHMVTLKGILTAIKEGDTTPEQVFAPAHSKNSEPMAAATDAKAQSLDDKYRKQTVNVEGPAADPDPSRPTGNQTAQAASPSAPPLRQASERQRSHHRSAANTEGVPLTFGKDE